MFQFIKNVAVLAIAFIFFNFATQAFDTDPELKDVKAPPKNQGFAVICFEKNEFTIENDKLTEVPFWKYQVQDDDGILSAYFAFYALIQQVTEDYSECNPQEKQRQVLTRNVKNWDIACPLFIAAFTYVQSTLTDHPQIKL